MLGISRQDSDSTRALKPGFFAGTWCLKTGASRGFTLIELLTVIAIIALLASIILASLTTARQRSRDGKRVSDVKNLQLALSLYFNDNSAYPATLSGLVPNYLSNLPTDPNTSVTSQTCQTTPSTAGCYYYAAFASGACNNTSPTATSYHLAASLEQTSNSALNNDTDTAAAAACSGSNADFPGADTAPCSGSGSGACYDVHS